MNFIKETNKYLKKIDKTKDSTYNTGMRKLASNIIAIFGRNRNNIPSELHAVLLDVMYLTGEYGNVSNFEVCQGTICDNIGKLIYKHTTVNGFDQQEFITLIPKYVNAVELFVYHNRDKYSSLDILKLFIINEVNCLTHIEQTRDIVTGELQAI